jgi:RimJ/RimL family protein N-acetyltransferase
MFSTSRLYIEPLVVAHAEQLLVALDDERVGLFIGGPDVSTLEALLDRIEFVTAGPADSSKQWLNFAVLFKGTVIGRLEATTYAGSIDHPPYAEIAYLVGPRWWGNGFATEATRWLIEYLSTQGIVEVWACVVPGNQASINLARRVGLDEVEAGARSLASYDDGDLVFRLVIATQETDV